MTTVMCFGTFDLFHKGHEFYLKEARKLADRLVVVVARDDTAFKIKKKMPVNDQDKRGSDVAYLADEVIIGCKGDKYAVIERIRPDIIALGYDQEGFSDTLDFELKKRGINAKVVRIGSHMPHKYKSSLIRKSMHP